MKRLIRDINFWYWCNQHVIYCKRMLAENPEWHQIQTELGWYGYLEECTASDIINSVRNFFISPFRWIASLFRNKKYTTEDELPF